MSASEPRVLHTGAALLLSLGLVVLAGCRRTPPGEPPLRVAAAADLAFAFEEAGRAFERKTSLRPVLVFGSTGLLAKQIAEGAPFDVFAAASVSYVEDVVRAGQCDGATRSLYARGRIVLWGRGPGLVPRSLAELASGTGKIALANPEHAPYGKAAREALERSGVWEAVRSRVVYGENVQQAMRYAETGDADVAFIALSLAVANPHGERLDVDQSLHAPIDQALVVCFRGKNAERGREFSAFVSSAEGRAIMRRYGFLLPGEVLAQAR